MEGRFGGVSEHGPVEYTLKIRVDGEMVHSHTFWPNDPHLDSDLETMRWHAVQDIKKRGLKSNLKKKRWKGAVT
jgi:hypothetical protein